MCFYQLFLTVTISLCLSFGSLLHLSSGTCTSYKPLNNSLISQYWVTSTGGGSSRSPWNAYDGNSATYYESLSSSVNLDVGYHWLILNISAHNKILSTTNITSSASTNLSVYLSNSPPEFQPGYDSKDQARLTAESWKKFNFTSGNFCLQDGSAHLFNCSHELGRLFTYVLITFKPKEVSTNVYEKLVIYEVVINYMIQNVPISQNMTSPNTWLVTCSNSVDSPDCYDFVICHSRDHTCWDGSYITAENISIAMDPRGPYHCRPRGYSVLDSLNHSVTWFPPLGKTVVNYSLISGNDCYVTYKVTCSTPESLPSSAHHLLVSTNTTFHIITSQSKAMSGIYGGNATLTSALVTLYGGNGYVVMNVSCIVLQDVYNVTAVYANFLVEGSMTITTTTTIATTGTTSLTSTAIETDYSESSSSVSSAQTNPMLTTTKSIYCTASMIENKEVLVAAITGGSVFFAMLLVMALILCLIRCRGYKIILYKKEATTKCMDPIPRPESMGNERTKETLKQTHKPSRASSLLHVYETVNAAVSNLINSQNTSEYVAMSTNNSIRNVEANDTVVECTGCSTASNNSGFYE